MIFFFPEIIVDVTSATEVRYCHTIYSVLWYELDVWLRV